MHTVELRNLRKTYGEFVAVDNVSLAVRPGEMFGLLGPNGAGKTSSIRMMIGITIPDAGEVHMFGERFRRAHLDRIGYLPEERGLYKKMKVLEHLVFLAQLKGVGAAEAKTRALRWCERLGLADWTEKKVEELSKGMQQKVQFIAALLHDPELIIMDEPFSGLDPANAVGMKDVLVELKRAGKTILFSTHRMDQVEKLCDSICLINHGRIVLHGDIKEVKGRYGKSHVQVQYDGDSSFLKDTSLVQSFNDYGNFVEVRLRPDADPQKLLHAAIRSARLDKFEVVEPSLEEIFIDVVGQANAPVAASVEKANA